MKVRLCVGEKGLGRGPPTVAKDQAGGREMVVPGLALGKQISVFP